MPADLTRPTRTYERHAWLALGGVLTFLALYVFLCAWFARAAHRNITNALAGGNQSLIGFLLGGVALLLAVFLLKALLAVSRPPKTTNVEVTPESEPELFRFLHRLADETSAPRPHRVFLSPDVNAAVSYDLSFLNLLFPSKKNLEIGLGLVNALTLSELKAVLAHEYGHFAQRTMAVGRWVYLAQQIAGQIVARRDWFDRVLQFLSSVDLRVAWFGWAMRLVVWSLRALLDTAFSLVLLAQRALSREMEFQADLVAVSVAGSDAIVHALHRLQAADEAFDRALEIATVEHRRGRRVPDLFALQSRVTERLRVILDDETYGAPPAVPAGERATHRVFEEKLLQTPRMWSTHPSNRAREDNAKRVYVDAELDDRPAWLLFRAPQELRERMTAQVLDAAGQADGLTPATLEEALSAVDSRFNSVALERRYRGAYLRRSPVLYAKTPKELLAPAGDASPAAVAEALSRLYPPSLAEQLKTWRNLEEELAGLRGLQDGVLTAPGGVIRHRGRVLERKELPAVIAAVKEERDRVHEALCQHDRACRTLHRRAAALLGDGWLEYLDGLIALLHYAGHAQADVDDAHGHFVNVFSVVIANGRVSKRKRERLVRAAVELYTAIWEVDTRRDEVALPRAVAERLRVPSWKDALPRGFPSTPPTSADIGDFLEGIHGWYRATSGALGALETATLEALLEAEAHVAEAFREQRDPGPAPEPARVPSRYTTRCPGTERERQRRLGLWDRFVTADGLVPSLARLAVALGIVVPVLGFSGAGGNATIVVYNALAAPVDVRLGSERVSVGATSKATVEVTATEHLPIETQTRAGVLVEAFEADASNDLVTHVYNVAGASPLAELTIVYGDRPRRQRRLLGAPRWLASTSDLLFQPPPRSIRGKSGGTKRTVLVGLAGEPPERVLGVIDSAPERERIIATHARFGASGSPHLFAWLEHASVLPNFRDLVAQRERDQPGDVAPLFLEQLVDDPALRSAACARHRALAASAPERKDLQRLVANCDATSPEDSAASTAPAP